MRRLTPSRGRSSTQPRIRPTRPPSEKRSVELGVRFNTAGAEAVAAIRFYRTAGNLGPHTATLWSAGGAVLATASIPRGETTGWQRVPLARPVSVVPNTTYTASYRASTGSYTYSLGTFSGGKTVSRPPLTAVAGVYSYADGVPTRTWNGSNYFVDVEFSAAPVATPAPAVTTAPAPKPTATAPASDAERR